MDVWIHSLWVLWILLNLNNVGESRRKRHRPACGGHRPADIVFIIDSSSSITKPDFVLQLKFIKSVVNQFVIGPDQTRIGVISYSNWAFSDFYLNKHSNATSVKRAVSRIKQIRGDTNTAAALAYMTDISFKTRLGARPGYPHIGILLTDGKSNHPKYTAKQARRAKKAGIHLFAIGVGDEIDQEELISVASAPAYSNVLLATEYSALKHIRQFLARRTCSVTAAPSTEPSPILPHPFLLDTGCSNAAYADVVFAMAPAASIPETHTTLNFFRKVVTSFRVGPHRTRIGLVPKDCRRFPVSDVTITNEKEKEDFINQINLIEEELSVSTILNYLRLHSFTERESARRDAKKMAMLVIDDTISDMQRVRRELRRMRRLYNAEIFVIGIGKSVEYSQLAEIGSQPDFQHVFHIGSYDELPSLLSVVKRNMCTPDDTAHGSDLPCHSDLVC